MNLAIIGVGSVGAALGERLTTAGYDVTFGVRAGKNIAPILERCHGRARGTSTAEACQSADVIFLAVPAEVAVEALAGAPLDGKIVVDCNNPVTWDDGPVWAPPAEGSVTAALAAAYPAARVLKGFATFGAEFHRNPDLEGSPVQVHLAGDDAEAKETVAEISRQAGFEPLDCGLLRNAAALENLAVLWIHLALQGPLGRDFVFQAIRRD